jgi:hypothetical protein
MTSAPTAAQLRADIAMTKAKLSDWLIRGADGYAIEDLECEIADMENELDEIESMEPVRAQRRAA